MHICTTYEQDKRELNANAALTGDLKVVPIEGKAHAAYTLTRKVPKDVIATQPLEPYTSYQHTFACPGQEAEPQCQTTVSA